MGRNRKPDRIVSTIQLADGRWLVTYVLKGKRAQSYRKTEIAARARANELQLAIDAASVQRIAHIDAARQVARQVVSGSLEDGDWRQLLADHARAVAGDPQDEAMQRAGRVLADLARADLAIRRSQKDDLGDDDARKLLADPEFAAKVDAMLGGGK